VAWRHLTNFILPAHALPEGLGENVFLVTDPAQPLHEDNALALFVTETEEAGRVCLQVVATTSHADPNHVAELGARVRARLREHLLPFLDRHLLSVSSPHEGDAAQAMDPVYRADDPGPLGVGATPVATGIKNLFLCGRQTLPGLGCEGELAAAWSAARLICGNEKKRDPLKEGLLLSRS
jgi:phytoene dehydrogenase-like protein